MKVLVENINRILSLMLLEKKNKEVELDESDILEDEEGGGAASGGGGSSTGYPSIEKWETGVARGPANSLGGKKEDKVTRGKGNMLGKAGEKWSSGRTFGKTGKYKT
jgi:hypothetical protein